MVEVQDRYDNACNLRERGSQLRLQLVPQDGTELDLQGMARLDRDRGVATVRVVVGWMNSRSWLMDLWQQSVAWQREWREGRAGGWLAARR